MNVLETQYAAHLEQEKSYGFIQWYAFEALTLKIADDCRYTPDFIVMHANGELQIHEVKGYWMDDALVKIKAAAEKFPFRFMSFSPIPKKKGGGWACRLF